MKLFGILSIVALMLVGIVACAQQEAETEAVTDGMFIHISHGYDNPHRVLMALRMAELVSVDHDVLVYFDITGVEVVLKDAEDMAYAEFPNLKAQLAKLSASDVTLMACPGCLQAAGKTPEDLAEGIQVADKEMFFGFTKGRILTLDY